MVARRMKPLEIASKCKSLETLDRKITECDACSRLVEWRTEVSQIKRRAYADHKYWGKPVAGFGPMNAKVVIVGLAPGAHGANRTGRIFTGDSSGDWLYRDRKSTRLNSSHSQQSRMPSSA